MKRAKPQVIKVVRVGFRSLSMTLVLLSEVQIIVKNREQTKNIRWDYIGKYTSGKRKELLKYGEKKKKKKKERKKITEPSVERKIESNHANGVTQEFLLAIFSKQRTKH